MQTRLHKCLLVLFFSLVVVFTLGVTNVIAADEKTQFNIRTHRMARISDGKMLEAIQFAKEVTDYINNKYPQFPTRVYSEAFGAVGTIHWFGECKDLATLERTIQQLFADPGYLSILSKAIGLFIEGSVHDTLLISIP